jgi:plasmid stabilization system protein ParE
VKAVRWSQQALSDLDDLAAWLIQRNPKAAAKAEIALNEAIVAITKRPEAWPKLTKFNVHVRSLPKWDRRIAYQIDGDFIVIVSVKHTRQNREI